VSAPHELTRRWRGRSPASATSWETKGSKTWSASLAGPGRQRKDNRCAEDSAPTAARQSAKAGLANQKSGRIASARTRIVNQRTLDRYTGTLRRTAIADGVASDENKGLKGKQGAILCQLLPGVKMQELAVRSTFLGIALRL